MSYFIDTSRTMKTQNDFLSDLFNNIEFSIKSCDRYRTHCINKNKIYMLNDYELILVTKGEFYISCEGKTYTAGKNSIILLEPYKLINTSSSNLEHVEYYFIHFDSNPHEYLSNTIDRIKGNNSIIITSEFHDDIYKIMHQAFEEATKKRLGYISVIKQITKYILISLFRNELAFENNEVLHSPHESKGKIDILSKATSFIADNVTNNIKVTDVTKHVSVSPNYLYKLFRQYLGITPISYIKKTKIQRAAQLLYTKKYSIIEISIMFHYTSPNHFSSNFKDVMGLSPTMFIRELKNS